MQVQTKPFEIHHITGKIYLFLFDEMYNLCIHFLRYQEFYESPKFRNKSFTILEFMEWYSKTYGKGAFTYSNDWAGFNIPGDVIWQVHTNYIPDHNIYDKAMLAAFNQISSTTHLFDGATKSDNFYVLGACKTEIGVLGHELAHGLYYTDASFKADMDKCLADLPKKVCHNTYDYFSSVGYDKRVFEDELQAYFATGLPTALKKHKSNTKPFQKVFNNYTKKIKFDPKTAKPLTF